MWEEGSSVTRPIKEEPFPPYINMVSNFWLMKVTEMSLGKNAKLASFDGGLTWYFQVYDADRICPAIW